MILNVVNLAIQLLIDRRLTHVVREVTFGVERKEILGVVGESGSGKSITSLAIMGLLPPGSAITADRFELCGHDLLGLHPREWRRIRGSKAALIFQNPMSALNPSLNVATQLSESIRRAEPNLRRGHVRRRAIELLDHVGIASAPQRLRAYPHELSGGMAQRVMIAMALACKPSLLIADEPTTGLDVTIQSQILDLLLRVRDENDMAVILVSHDIGVVQDYADRILVMYSGEVVETATTPVLVGDSRHPYTQGLLKSSLARQGIGPKTPLATIRGVALPVGSSIEGCRFVPRCPLAADCCKQHPELVSRLDHPGAASRCHF